MVDRTAKYVPALAEPTLVRSGGPKRRENASWPSSVTSWSRNTRTECSSKAARTAAYAASSASTSRRVTLRSSAAKPGPRGRISIDDVLQVFDLRNFQPGRTKWQDAAREVSRVLRRRRRRNGATPRKCGPARGENSD